MSRFKGLNFHASDHISGILDNFFQNMSDEVLSPEFRKIKYGKNIVFSAFPEASLPAIFKIALEQKHALTPVENDVLKKLLLNANEYIDALKAKTKANLLGELDSYISTSALKGIQPDSTGITEILKENLDKAGNHFQVITEAEATKVRNLGRAINITKSGADMGVEDPLCYFVVVRDDVTCENCIHNHLMPDGTPRLFRMSELTTAYLSSADRKEGKVSVCGQHPNCRCSLQQLPPFYGFVNGKVKYVGRGKDPLAEQRGEEQ